MEDKNKNRQCLEFVDEKKKKHLLLISFIEKNRGEKMYKKQFELRIKFDLLFLGK